MEKYTQVKMAEQVALLRTKKAKKRMAHWLCLSLISLLKAKK